MVYTPAHVILLLLLLAAWRSTAQVYPIQATTQLIPPYSVYLSDYATSNSERLRVILLQRDLTQSTYRVSLHMMIELDGRLIIRTSPAFNPPPITLHAGVPIIISGRDLAPYVDSRNMEFVGYNREHYERTKSLPEGSYRITFVAYDYVRREAQVSNAATGYYHLSKSEPPLINLPACGSTVTMRSPQQMVFSWLSRNTSSPNSAFETEFELTLYETRPEGRVPNDVVISSSPVFRVLTTQTQYIYGVADPALIPGMRYVWRVQAIDKTGRDSFRNNGFSETCTFTYSANDPDFDLGVVRNLQAKAESDRRAKVWWDRGHYDGYVIHYKKSGTGFEWFSQHIAGISLPENSEHAELTLFDLEPNTDYEIRVQAGKHGHLGSYSDIVKFKTMQELVYACGESPPTVKADASRPNRGAFKGMTVHADHLDLHLDEVLHLGDGWYKGTATTSISYFGGAVFAVSFDRLYIDADRIAGFGRMEFVTEGMATALREQTAAAVRKQKETIQEYNREQWKDIPFADRIILYDQIVINEISIDGQTLIIRDDTGEVFINHEVAAILADAPGQAIIIEDSNRDQYVAQRDDSTGEIKLSKVDGGGLLPGSDVPATPADLDLIKKVLHALRTECNDQLPDATKELARASAALQELIRKNHEQYLQPGNYIAYTISRDVIEIESDDNVDPVGRRFKEAELRYNLLVVGQAFSRDNQTEQSYKIVLRDLKIDGRTLPQYLEVSRTNSVAEHIQVATLLQELKNIIRHAVLKYVYEL